MMGKVVVGVFVGVFIGAVAYEILRKSKISQAAAGKISEGLRSAKTAFDEGYQSVTRPEGERA